MRYEGKAEEDVWQIAEVAEVVLHLNAKIFRAKADKRPFQPWLNVPLGRMKTVLAGI